MARVFVTPVVVTTGSSPVPQTMVAFSGAGAGNGISFPWSKGLIIALLPTTIDTVTLVNPNTYDGVVAASKTLTLSTSAAVHVLGNIAQGIYVDSTGNVNIDATLATTKYWIGTTGN